MRRPILVLSDDLASQIAAGEVVERPASVVKELVENSLDAGASRIRVSIEAGGIALIEIADDGQGMAVADAALCLGRHATSKLSHIDDLEELLSYGFRGEALPSIASVSRLSIHTRAEGADDGLALLAEGTTEPQQKPVGHPVGCTISVRDLFFNVPARRKFLRSSNTESGHVAEVVVDAALSCPEVSFSLQRDGRVNKNFERASSLQERVEQVFPGEELLALSGQRGPLSVQAFVSAPERARRGATALKLFVNGRAVRDRAVLATVAHAYGPRLERGRYPRGVVYLELPTRLVDVNVHPQKTEVRFADARAVCDAVYGVIARGLTAQGLHAQEQAAEQADNKVPLAAASSNSSKGARGHVMVQPGRGPVSGQRYVEHFPSKGPEPSEKPAESESLKRLKSTVLAQPQTAAEFAQSSNPEQPQKPLAMSDKPAELARGQAQLRLLGQAQESYLVCTGKEGIYTLDQHAADEVGIFYRLQDAYQSGGLPSQSLLFPVTLSLSKKASQSLLKRGVLLLRLGLDLRERSAGTMSLHAVPGLLKRATPEQMIDAFLEAARQHKEEADILRAFFSLVACQEAVSQGQNLSVGDAQAVLRALGSRWSGKNPCLHGRTVLQFNSFAELARKRSQ